jgi:hypothetical protein
MEYLDKIEADRKREKIREQQRAAVIRKQRRDELIAAGKPIPPELAIRRKSSKTYEDAQLKQREIADLLSRIYGSQSETPDKSGGDDLNKYKSNQDAYLSALGYGSDFL